MWFIVHIFSIMQQQNAVEVEKNCLNAQQQNELFLLLEKKNFSDLIHEKNGRHNENTMDSF